MSEGFFRKCLKDIRQKKEVLQTNLCSGAFDSFDEYKRAAGKYEGLCFCENILSKAYQEANESGFDFETEDTEE